MGKFIPGPVVAALRVKFLRLLGVHEGSGKRSGRVVVEMHPDLGEVLATRVRGGAGNQVGREKQAYQASSRVTVPRLEL